MRVRRPHSTPLLGVVSGNHAIVCSRDLVYSLSVEVFREFWISCIHEDQHLYQSKMLSKISTWDVRSVWSVTKRQREWVTGPLVAISECCSRFPKKSICVHICVRDHHRSFMIWYQQYSGFRVQEHVWERASLYRAPSREDLFCL